MTPAEFREHWLAAAATRPRRAAFTGARGETVPWGALDARVEAARVAVRGLGAPVVAILADNGLPAVLVDLACLIEGIALVPLPPFFTDAQIRHACAAAGAAALLSDDGARVRAAFHGRAPRAGSIEGLHAFRVGPPVPAPPGVARITFTSGTTGDPKGVLLSAEAMLAVAASLADATEMTPEDRHVGLLPLGVLLENVGGPYRTVIAGASAALPPLAELGVAGSSAIDAPAALRGMARLGATTGILVPGMLDAIVAALEADPGLRPPSARFFGVGGARVSPSLLRRAAAAGFPAFEGYGLSEAASVVTLNTPRAPRAGSVGRPLRHAEVRVAGDGEVLVRGATFLGYAGAEGAPDAAGWWRTGDVGRLDGDGFLHLLGRRRNVFITSFGRNVSPEWVEGALVETPSIARAVVFGEGRAAPVAVLVPREGCADRVAADVERANATLPDYARVARFVVAPEPLSAANGLLTPNGRPRRDAVFAAYGARLDPKTEGAARP